MNTCTDAEKAAAYDLQYITQFREHAAKTRAAHEEAVTMLRVAETQYRRGEMITGRAALRTERGT